MGAIILAMGSAALATPKPASGVVHLVLKDHRFSPETIYVPAGRRVKIDFVNQDATADDFDSDDLHVDKDLGPHGHTAFYIGSLKPGTYAFKGELHAETAHGTVVVTEATVP
jgi:plastocyanin